MKSCGASRGLAPHAGPDPHPTEAARNNEYRLDLVRNEVKSLAGALLWRIPVCFQPDSVSGIDDLSNSKQLLSEDVIALMTQTVFLIYMLRILPGFPCLGARAVLPTFYHMTNRDQEAPQPFHLIGLPESDLLTCRVRQQAALLLPNMALSQRVEDDREAAARRQG
jgi:hypothetical protein